MTGSIPLPRGTLRHGGASGRASARWPVSGLAEPPPRPSRHPTDASGLCARA